MTYSFEQHELLTRMKGELNDRIDHIARNEKDILSYIDNNDLLTFLKNMRLFLNSLSETKKENEEIIKPDETFSIALCELQVFQVPSNSVTCDNREKGDVFVRCLEGEASKCPGRKIADISVRIRHNEEE